MNIDLPQVKSPAITIITPTWNGHPYFKQAAESVLGQACQEWRWLISDDGSSDGTREYLAELEPLGKGRINVFYQPANLGIFGNLNFLCEQVRTDLILILCQDDYFTSCHSVSLALCKWQSLDASVGMARWNSANHPVCRLANPLLPSQSQLAFFLHGCLPGNLSNISFRKSAWLEVGPFSLRYPYAGDFYYWAHFCSRFCLVFFPENAVFIRTHKDQASIFLNERGELYQQLAEIVSEIYLRITPMDMAPRVVLRIAGTTVYYCQQIRTMLRPALTGRPSRLASFLESIPSQKFLLPRIGRFFLFILTAGGLVGKSLILRMAWSMNNPE
jgi:glycosyltransferase involved in cell wall biosynthesis